MKNKKIKISRIFIFSIMIFSLLFLFSCSSRNDQGLTPEQAEALMKELYSGTQGLNAVFYDNTPPQEVVENTIFQVIFDIENKGAFPIQNGYFTLATEKDYVEGKGGQFKDNINLSPNKIYPFSLNSRTLYDKNGESQNVMFTFQAKQLENYSLYHDVSFRLTSCYDYSTYLVADICVNIDQYIPNSPIKGVCEFQPLTYNGQGGPVGISLIDVNILPWEDTYRPEFYFEINNYGTGTILNKNDIEKACTNQPIERTSINVVNFNGTFLGKPLTCTPAQVFMKDGFGKTRCYTERFKKEELQNKRSFISPLLVKFDYGYTQTWSTKTKITKLPTH